MKAAFRLIEYILRLKRYRSPAVLTGHLTAASSDECDKLGLHYAFKNIEVVKR